MILADKIMTLRKRNGWSQEELASRLGVSRQSVSKWESAGSIPELDKILQMAKIFGVSVDYLLKDELEMEEEFQDEYTAEEELAPPLRRVTMDEAYAYMELIERSSHKFGFGVGLCILSPIALILFSLLTESGTWALSENISTALGIVILLLMVAAAVGIFITTAMAGEDYGYLTKEFLDTEYGVDGIVKERQRLYRPVFIRNITIGVMLCILSVIPLIVFAALDASDLICGFGIAILLIVVSFAVYLFIRAAMINDSYHVLLQTEDYSRKKKTEAGNKRNSAVTSAYWCLVTAIYLAYSFISGDWHISWVVWAVAGVLYGVVEAVLQMTNK